MLNKKTNRMSGANFAMFERSELSELQRILDFLLLRNLLNNELFFSSENYSPSYLFIKFSLNSLNLFSFIALLASFISLIKKYRL